uniref:Flavin reductase family protein n=1 Tax=Ignisphaera aggregans TaxID=334771 RepID=A0A7C5TGV8_9CREN
MSLTNETKPRKFYYLLHPRPVVVIITQCPEGKVNAMPASWITPVSEDPPTIAISIDKSSFTSECLKHSNEATINIPSLNHVELLYKLGTVSGREVDKVSEFKLKLIKSKMISTPRWADAIGWLEAKVNRYIDIGDVRLYIFEIIEYGIRKDVGSEWGWNTYKANLVHHGIGKGFYTIGRLIIAK